MFLFAAFFAATAAADEGMWLLPYLQKMNIADMRAKGCELSAEEIYAADRSSLKDAIVIFGAGCTGEVVSPDGLLLTNHHCGYGAIQSLSSVEHDFLKNGFWARSRAEELPAPGLEVRFVRRIADVTADVLGAVPSTAMGEERAELVKKQVAEVRKRFGKEYPGMEISVKPFFGGNQYFAFAMEVYKDIRLVGTPPNSIGKFGGDTDNWMWPRHTGDFSLFRIYADRENRPAKFSRENVPYRPARYFPVSTKGIREGDFTMIYGFPGNTQEYILSDAVAYIAETHLTKRAKAVIERYLGHSIVYDASWMDDYRAEPGYEMTNWWHVDYGKGEPTKDAAGNPLEPNVLRELNRAIERLRDYRNLDDSTVVVNLRYVIHLVGDMHCPSHVNYQQSRMRVLFYGVDTQYHALFDGGILDRKHRWGYMEYKHQLDRYSRREREALAAGTPDDWFAESRRECAVIYDWAAPGDKLGLSFCNKAIGLLDHQLIKASYRLAKVLNELFG